MLQFYRARQEVNFKSVKSHLNPKSNQDKFKIHSLKIPTSFMSAAYCCSNRIRMSYLDLSFDRKLFVYLRF